MNKVGELDRVLNKEDWNIVPDNIPIALAGVEFGSKAASIPDSILKGYLE